MITEIVAKLINQTVNKTYNIFVEADISYPEVQFGDFASNIAFGLAKELKKAPSQIAQEIAASLSDSRVQQVSAAGGFVNITMNPEFWIEQLHTIKPGYAATTTGNNKKVQVEFISANPTGPLTLANGRGGFTGDVLANVLQHGGYEVEREYYVNDAGNQIVSLGKTLKGEEQLYAGDYIDGLKPHVDLSQPAAEIGRQAAEVMLDQIKAATARMNIQFDRWFSEASVIESKLVDEIFAILERAGATYTEEGALWLATTKHGDDKDRVLRKADGELTYLASDIAHYYQTFVDYSFDHKINILGADHHGYVSRMQAAVEMLRLAKGFSGYSTILITQMVRLVQDGKEVRMSKRAGTYVAMDDLLDEIPTDVARWFFLMRSRDSQMEFDLDLAKEQSQKNPLYYVMYSYARAHSILAQAADRKLSPISTVSELAPQEALLVRQMTRLPELLAEIIRDYGVHRLTFYGVELARLFHDLYESEKIIDLDKAKACKKLYLIQQYITFMNGYWSLLGITPLKTMGEKPVKV